MTRSIVIALLIAGLVAAAFVALAGQGSSATIYEPRRAGDVLLDHGITADQAAAFRQGPVRDTSGPAIVHPPDGAVFPTRFPAPRIQWSDEYASRTYEVTVRHGDEVLFRGVTRRRELTPSADSWEAVRAAGEVTVEVVGGLVDADGRVTGELSRSVATTLTLAAEAEGPNGMILFGAKHRPAGAEVGTVPLLMMHLRIDAFDVERLEHRVVFRSSHGPEPTKVHPTRMEEERGGPDERDGGRGDGPDRDDPHAGMNGGEITTTQCVSCHAISGDGRHIAVFSQTAEESPARFDAPNGFMTVLRMPEREVVVQLPHAFVPQFHPKDPNILVFGEVDETIGIKDQQMVRKSDLRILDLRTRQHYPLPGAAEPDRVENFPFWSPDGKQLTFIRTRQGEIWHGAQGLINVGVIDYNGGQGGKARDLPGASNNGRSNFLPVYSPDGRWIVYTQAEKGFFSQDTADMWIVPAEGGEARPLSACNSGLTESWHRFSPDGNWLGFVTNREDIRRPHIYLTRFDTLAGTCSPPVQLPVVAGPGAHTHAFSWTPRFDWIQDYELVRAL